MKLDSDKIENLVNIIQRSIPKGTSDLDVINAIIIIIAGIILRYPEHVGDTLKNAAKDALEYMVKDERVQNKRKTKITNKNLN